MASKGYTKKPCHGCGKTPRDYGGRPTEGLCGDCSSLMKWAREAQGKLTAQKDKKLYALPWAPHGLPYIPHGKRSFSGDDPTPKDVFMEKFFDLIYMLGEASPTSIWSNEPVIDGTEYGRTTSAYFDPDVVQALDTIHQCVRKMTEEAYEEGLSDGRRFLVSLAKGEVSIEKYNEVTVNGK